MPKSVNDLCRSLAVISSDPTGARLASKIARCAPDSDPGELVAKFRSTVIIIEERTNRDWYLGLAGSHESLFVGKSRPNLELGDSIEVTLRKLDVT